MKKLMPLSEVLKTLRVKNANGVKSVEKFGLKPIQEMKVGDRVFRLYDPDQVLELAAARKKASVVKTLQPDTPVLEEVMRLTTLVLRRLDELEPKINKLFHDLTESA